MFALTHLSLPHDVVYWGVGGRAGWLQSGKTTNNAFWGGHKKDRGGEGGGLGTHQAFVGGKTTSKPPISDWRGSSSPPP